jgi:peptidoglycan/xylan/chitin deacetylase (PgdA/CDA1 family)
MKPALVLAYHGLGSLPRHLDPHNLMVAPEQFRAQVRSLKRRGYRFLPLLQFVERLDAGMQVEGVAVADGGAPTPGTCALTFDDGTLDNVELLPDLLSELDVPATVFACPGLLGSPHFAMPPAAGVRLMNAEELCELARSPLVEIGSHTNTHVDLAHATALDAHREMATSKQALEDLLQRPVDAFAYPKCGYSPTCPDAACRAGYAVAVTCGARGGWRRFELTRESVDTLDGRITFALKSRRLFMPLRDSPAGRAARAAARPLRHGRDRGQPPDTDIV